MHHHNGETTQADGNMIDKRRTARLIGIFMMALTGLTGALTMGGTAGAHHPEISATVDRP